jgi:hypothetical protein
MGAVANQGGRRGLALEIQPEGSSSCLSAEIHPELLVSDEHQFMNLGWGSHVKEVVRILGDHGVAFKMSS